MDKFFNFQKIWQKLDKFLWKKILNIVLGSLWDHSQIAEEVN